MKRSKFTEDQIAFALKQQELGSSVDGDEHESTLLESEDDRLQRELDTLEDALTVFPPDLVAQAGCVVFVGRSGAVKVKRGLVRPADRDALVQAARQSVPRETEAGSALVSLPKGGTRAAHSEKLMRSLTAHRVAAIQAELLSRPDVALAAVTAQLAVKLLGDGFRHYRGCDEGLTVSAGETHDALRRECGNMADAEAWKLMEQARAEWIARLPEGGAALLPWLLAQERATVVGLLTFLVASSVTGIDGVERERQSTDALAWALALDMRRWWKAGAASYFIHVSKATTLAAVTEAAGANAAATLAGLKKEGPRRVRSTCWQKAAGFHVACARSHLPDGAGEYRKCRKLRPVGARTSGSTSRSTPISAGNCIIRSSCAGRALRGGGRPAPLGRLAVHGGGLT